MKITILGAGNVATQLALAFKKAGHEIVQIYNRSDDAGKELARTVGASFTSNTSDLKEADVYIMAVKDDVIKDVAATIKVGDKIIAHTSGTRSKDLLKASGKNFGVFYPLQTLSRQTKVDFRYVPMLVEGNSDAVTGKLLELGTSIAHHVHKVDEEQRQWIHIAAVFANNFTNHLLTISESLLKEHGMSLDLLRPLIFKFIQNLHEHSPAEIQTGPAIRNDVQTINQHLELLKGNKNAAEIYKVITDSIIQSRDPKRVKK